MASQSSPSLVDTWQPGPWGRHPQMGQNKDQGQALRRRSGSEPRFPPSLHPLLLFTDTQGFLDAAHESEIRTKSGVGTGIRATPPLHDAHAAAWSSGTPPTKRSVSRLRPSVPLGLWPRTGVSPSTESVPRRQCRDSSRRCHRPGSTSTVLVSTAGPEPVSNLGAGRKQGLSKSCLAPPFACP